MPKSAQSPMVSHFEAVFEKFEKCNFQYKIAKPYFIGVCAGCDGRKVPRCRVSNLIKNQLLKSSEFRFLETFRNLRFFWRG